MSNKCYKYYILWETWQLQAHSCDRTPYVISLIFCKENAIVHLSNMQKFNKAFFIQILPTDCNVFEFFCISLNE